MHFHQHPAVAAQIARDRATPASRGHARVGRRWPSISTLLVLFVTVGLLVAGTAKAAPMLIADRPCYSLLTPVTLAGDGFTPDGDLVMAATVTYPDGTKAGVGAAPGVADSQGHMDATFGVPQIDVRRLGFTATVSDLARIAQGAPLAEQSASTTVTLTPFGAYFAPWNTDGPARARVGRRARLEVDGYIGTASRTLYVHYVRHGRAIKTQRIGRLDRECGSLTTRFRQFAFRPVKPGAYRVIFDTTRRWPNKDTWSGYRRVVVAGRQARVTHAGVWRNLEVPGHPFGDQILQLGGRSR